MKKNWQIKFYRQIFILQVLDTKREDNHVAKAVSCGLPVIFYKDTFDLKKLFKELGFIATNYNI